MEVVIFESEDGTESGMCLREDLEKHIVDTDGNRMAVRKAFEALDWDDAKDIYERWMDEEREAG